MEKRNYVKPLLNSEEFVPQTYVAACGDVDVTWSIKCNVPYGFGFLDNNSNGKYDEGDTYLAKGSGCNEVHTGVTLPQGQTPSANAMWQDLKSRYSDYDNENNWDGNAYGTFYWEARSWGNDSHHFSIASEGDWHKENLS